MKGCFFKMFAAVRQEQSIYRDRLGVYQRHGDSIAEPGDDSAGHIGSEVLPNKIWDSLRNFWMVGVQGGHLYARNLSFLGVHFGLEYNCTVFLFPSLVCISATEFGWWMHGTVFIGFRRFGTVRHWTTKNRWFQKLVLPSLKHTMSTIPSLKKAIGKVDTIQWCISDDPMVLPSLKQFSFADLEGVPAYSQGGVWPKLTKGGSSSKRKVPRQNETKVDTINQHEDVSVTSQFVSQVPLFSGNRVEGTLTVWSVDGVYSVSLDLLYIYSLFFWVYSWKLSRSWV